MPRRTAPPDPSIGDRIRSRRELHGWSIRHAASRAGVAHSTWSRIEHGTLGTDNRFILAKVAEALEWSLSDLAQTVPPTDADSVAAFLGVSAVRQALIETDLDEVGTVVPRPLTVLAADVEHAHPRAGLASRLPARFGAMISCFSQSSWYRRFHGADGGRLGG